MQLGQQFQIHPNQITGAKKQILERAPEIFEQNGSKTRESDVKELCAKIGQLTIENDFLSVALSRMDGSSANT